MPKQKRPAGGAAPTLQMCSALKDPQDPSKGRCMLQKGHAGNIHEGIDSEGKRLMWAGS